MMALFRGFITLSSAYRCLFKPKMISLKAVNFATVQNTFSRETCPLSRYNQARCLAIDSFDAQGTEKAKPKRERAKTPEAPKITLLDLNDNITVCTMEAAEKLATGKKLKLVQVVDAKLKTQRPTYKLMSEADYFEEDLSEKRRLKEEKKNKNNAFVKGNKLMTLSTRSTEHDLEVKINKALKWFEKRYEIRIIILGSAAEAAKQEEIYKKFEIVFTPVGRLVQKRIKKDHMKFQIIPPKREDSESKGGNDDDEKGSDSLENEEIQETECEAAKESLR